jgi:hypothetical protein
VFSIGKSQSFAFFPLFFLFFEKSQQSDERQRRAENVFLSSSFKCFVFLVSGFVFGFLFPSLERESLMTLESLQWNVYSTRTTIACWSNDVEQCNYFFNSPPGAGERERTLSADKSLDDEWEFV